MIRIVVYGQPGPQGSKAFKGVNKRTGRAILVESSQLVRPWRQDVSLAAVLCRQTAPAGPLRVSITFTLPKPQNAPKRRQTYPCKKPDLDKLVRSTFDALTTAGVWEDDARVVELQSAKRYPKEGAQALDRPGAMIDIEALCETPMPPLPKALAQKLINLAPKKPTFEELYGPWICCGCGFPHAIDEECHK